jgi:anti-sigma B factor antagonist
VDLRVSSAAERTVLSVAGEVDVANAGSLRERLEDLLTHSPRGLIVDLTPLTFIDSTGLGVLVGARNRAMEIGVPLALVCAQERVLKLFRITGLDAVFEIHPTLEAATGRAGTN